MIEAAIWLDSTWAASCRFSLGLSRVIIQELYVVQFPCEYSHESNIGIHVGIGMGIGDSALVGAL